MMRTRWRWVVFIVLVSVLVSPAAFADSQNSFEERTLFLKEGILPLSEDISQATRKFQEMLKKFKEYHYPKDSDTRYTLQIVPPPHDFDQKAVVEPDDSVHYHMIVVNPDTRKHFHKFFPRFPKHTPR